MKRKPDVLSFYKKYGCFSNIEKIDKFNKSIKVKKCKYCGLSEPKVSFANKPHIIPELMGKNAFTSNCECDTCNSKFGFYENDLSVFIAPFLTLMNLKAKKKIPTFASRKIDKQKATKIFIKDSQRQISIDTTSDLVIDREGKTGILKIRRQSANSINVYKALAKIGILLMDDNDIPQYKEFINWILEKEDTSYNHIPLFVIRNMIQGKYFETPYASIYKLKNENFGDCVRPQYNLIIMTANLILQIPYPMFCGKDESKPLELELIPDILLYNQSGFYKVFDLSEKSVSLDEEIRFKFKDIE